MASKVKEEERNERIIRGLLKLAANRRCINCNNLGPQYVCTNFWTFICTNCSGIHREFTHRVKSVSMAKFTSQEVSSLQEGGNERAKEIYFKEWDLQRNSYPDSSNIDRLRDFIKHVYVDRRFSGERSMDRPPRMKDDREELSENRRDEPYRGGSRSPPYGETYERQNNERPGSGGRYDDKNARYGYEERSPGYDPGNFKKNPARFEVVDDRFRDDKFGDPNQNWRFEHRRFSDGPDKTDVRSPNHQRDIGSPSPPMVRPVREILGDDAPQLRVGELPKPNGIKVQDNSSKTKRTSSSSSTGSTDGGSLEKKTSNSGAMNLIDFNADSSPPPISATPQQSGYFTAVPQQSVPQQAPPAAGGDWASFDAFGQQAASQPSSSVNSLESALSQLAAPVTQPPPSNLFSSIAGVDSSQTNVGGQWNTVQISHDKPSLFSVVTGPQVNAPLGGSLGNQPWGSTQLPTPFTIRTGQQSQDNNKSHHEIKSPVSSQLLPAEGKPSGRKALPENLFTALYSSAPISAPVWHGAQYGIGYGMHYPSGSVVPSFPQVSSTANPFDLGNEPGLHHASSFPSMTSLQGALPNPAVSLPIMRSSSFGSPTPQWMLPQQASLSTPASSGPYMVNQVPPSLVPPPASMIPMGHQGVSFGGPAFAVPRMDQQLAARMPHPGTQNPFPPGGGNPFG